MPTHDPTVSVLITTYNRSRLLRRAILSVLGQDFRDYELVIIDDCSTDDTREVVATFQDPRIRYLRNETNVGSKEGDRGILRRFVYELMRGKYFVYLCDDDYWLFPNLLQRQVDEFRRYSDLVMVIGGQLSYFLTTPDSYFEGNPDTPMTITLDNIDRYFDLATSKSRTPHIGFMRASEHDPLFAKSNMTSDEFLQDFASNPATKNIIGGAMLYSRELFLKSGALKSPQGSIWQAGYELKMGPGCYGRTIYFDEPSIVTEIRGGNASFRGTQVEHYLDSVKSVEIAFETPLSDPTLRPRRKFIKGVRNKTLRMLSNSFLANTLAINRYGALSLCSDENIEQPVTFRAVLPVFARNNIVPTWRELSYLIAAELSPGAIDWSRRLSGGHRAHS
jgi:glycosyltransferase involved in cell wall biosynthesis